MEEIRGIARLAGTTGGSAGPHHSARSRHDQKRSGQGGFHDADGARTTNRMRSWQKSEDHVFTRGDGKPVLDFRGMWANVCCAAGVGDLTCSSCDRSVDAEKRCANCGRDWTRDELKYKGLIFHDLRRTAVRNMVRAGVSERVAMSISGHKTRSVFDRYHIVAPSDLRDAARKLENSQQQEREALEKSRASEFGQSLGIVAPKLQQNSKILKLHPSMAPLPADKVTWCPGPELNRYVPFGTRDFKSRASASFATRAR